MGDFLLLKLLPELVLLSSLGGTISIPFLVVWLAKEVWLTELKQDVSRLDFFKDLEDALMPLKSERFLELKERGLGEPQEMGLKLKELIELMEGLMEEVWLIETKEV